MLVFTVICEEREEGRREKERGTERGRREETKKRKRR